jgi:hypothetical protein
MARQGAKDPDLSQMTKVCLKVGNTVRILESMARKRVFKTLGRDEVRLTTLASKLLELGTVLAKFAKHARVRALFV